MPTKKVKEDTKEFFAYKERPLVRQGNTLYYGSMADKYVIMLLVNSETDFQDLKLADEVTVQLMLTDPDIRPKDRIVKKSEKKGLYQALDIASIWLDRALGK